MQNALLISINKIPRYVIPVHEFEFWSANQILDHYCEKFELPRERMSAQWVDAFDITNIENGQATPISPAKNDWS
jgi:hypothetical protein